MAHLAHYKEAHPLIFVVTHWINLIAMIMLILSGIIIHFPVLPFLTGIARGCHLFFGFVLFINCVARVSWPSSCRPRRPAARASR